MVTAKLKVSRIVESFCDLKIMLYFCEMKQLTHNLFDLNV